MFLCAEMMLQGISVTLTAWGQFHDNWGGQLMVIFVITVAACEAGIALALVLMLGRAAGTLDVTVWQRVRDADTGPYVDREIPEETAAEPHWPSLTPAGIEPPRNPRDEWYRSHV
jgi:NADH-quinone oxidoreductase subunit K